MINQYKPEEFTLSAYKALLNQAKNRFIFQKYTTYSINENFILWRHDVDHSLEQATIIANIEASYQIQSIFFLHLHNDFYNLLDYDSLTYVKEIMHLGHSIALHFDAGYYQIKSKVELEKWLSLEKEILENIFNTPITVFSFHNPNKDTSVFEEETYAKMVNTYSKTFKNKITYSSDSNGYWRFRKLHDVLVDPTVQKLQVLTHPEWWTNEQMMPREKILRYANKRAIKTMEKYDEILNSSNRINLT